MSRRNDRFQPLHLVGIAALMLAVTLAAIALFASRARIVTLVSDDSYYYLQVANNLATSGISSFDGVTRTSGYHPLFAALLAGLYALIKPGPDAYVRIMLAMNVLLHLLTGLILYFAGQRLRDKFTGILAAAFYLANPHATLWPLSGMEAALSGFSLSLFFLVIIPPLRGTRRVLLAGLFAALAVLARTDNLVVVLLSTPLILFANDGKLAPRIAAAAFVAGLAVAALGFWMWYCHTATGSWIQGSAQIKMLIRDYKVSGMSPLQAVAFTFDVFQKFAVKSFVKTPALKYLILLALATGPAFFKTSIRRALWPAYLAGLPLVLAAAYALKLTRTATWYYVPPVIALTLLSALAARKLLERETRRARVIALVVAVLIAAEGIGYFSGKMLRGRNVYQRDMLELAEWMREHLPKDSVVGAWDSGIYSFYSGLRVVNLDGLMNNDIADMMKANKPLWPAWHAKGIDSVSHYEFWYAGVPDQYWRYWKRMNIRYIAGSTRWLRNIPAEWDGGTLVTVREPAAQHSSSPKALYEIRWRQD